MTLIPRRTYVVCPVGLILWHKWVVVSAATRPLCCDQTMLLHAKLHILLKKNSENGSQTDVAPLDQSEAYDVS